MQGEYWELLELKTGKLPGGQENGHESQAEKSRIKLETALESVEEWVQPARLNKTCLKRLVLAERSDIELKIHGRQQAG